MKSSAVILIAGLGVVAGICPSFAQTDTIFATYTYTMGDNDTKSDARQLCFLYAKRECLEKAGTFVQSELSVLKTERLGSAGSSYDELTQQDISTFTGAFVKVDILSEQWSYSGENMTITVGVKAIVDVGSIYDQIVALKKDEALLEMMQEQQDQLSTMERQLDRLEQKVTEAKEEPKANDWLDWYDNLYFDRRSHLFEYEMEVNVKMYCLVNVFTLRQLLE
jgi:fructose-specific phosphotransferase system component IIB